MKTNETFITNAKKSYLLYSDYTMSTDPVEKETFLEMLSTYIYALDNPKATLMYQKVCDSFEEEKELYISLLGDVLGQINEEV